MDDVARYRQRSLWLDGALADSVPRPPLESDVDADVAIAGAGFTGLWTAYALTERDPGLRIAIVEREVKRRGPQKAIYIDTYSMFASQSGGYSEYLENDKGDTIKVRAGDGVHFESAGGDMIAREVLRQLNKVYDLTSWRHKPGA